MFMSFQNTAVVLQENRKFRNISATQTQLSRSTIIAYAVDDETSSSAVADEPRDAQCLTVVSFDSIRYLQRGLLLSRVSILTRNIDIAHLSVCLSVCQSVRYVRVPDKNGLTYHHSFFSPYGSTIILVLPASNVFTTYRRGHPLRVR